MNDIDTENSMEAEEMEQEVELSFTGILPSPQEEKWETKTVPVSLLPSDTISHVFEKLQKAGIPSSNLPDHIKTSETVKYNPKTTIDNYTHHTTFTVSPSFHPSSPSTISPKQPFRSFLLSTPITALLNPSDSSTLTIDSGNLTISFHRTLRLPDDENLHQLPASLGKFPLYNVSAFNTRLPDNIVEKGGVFFPMWQREAVWLEFEVKDVKKKYAIRVFVGKVNAVSGGLMDDDDKEKENSGKREQDYIVVPGQPWLDGICVEEGIVRQFVAMPLGSGYTVEGQKTGEEKHGGLQLEITPMDEQKTYRIEPRGNNSREKYVLEPGKHDDITPESLGLWGGDKLEITVLDGIRPACVRDLLDELGGKVEVMSCYDEQREKALKQGWLEAQRSKEVDKDREKAEKRKEEIRAKREKLAELKRQREERAKTRTSDADRLEALRLEKIEKEREEKNRVNAERKAEKLRQLREAKEAKKLNTSRSRADAPTREVRMFERVQEPVVHQQQQGDDERAQSPEPPTHRASKLNLSKSVTPLHKQQPQVASKSPRDRERERLRHVEEQQQRQIIEQSQEVIEHQRRILRERLERNDRRELRQETDEGGSPVKTEKDETDEAEKTEDDKRTATVERDKIVMPTEVDWIEMSFQQKRSWRELKQEKLKALQRQRGNRQQQFSSSRILPTDEDPADVPEPSTKDKQPQRQQEQAEIQRKVAQQRMLMQQQAASASPEAVERQRQALEQQRAQQLQAQQQQRQRQIQQMMQGDEEKRGRPLLVSLSIGEQETEEEKAASIAKLEMLQEERYGSVLEKTTPTVPISNNTANDIVIQGNVVVSDEAWQNFMDTENLGEMRRRRRRVDEKRQLQEEQENKVQGDEDEQQYPKSSSWGEIETGLCLVDHSSKGDEGLSEVPHVSDADMKDPAAQDFLKRISQLSGYSPGTIMEPINPPDKRAGAIAAGHAASTPTMQANFRGFTFVDEASIDEEMERNRKASIDAIADAIIAQASKPKLMVEKPTDHGKRQEGDLLEAELEDPSIDNRTHGVIEIPEKISEKMTAEEIAAMEKEEEEELRQLKETMLEGRSHVVEPGHIKNDLASIGDDEVSQPTSITAPASGSFNNLLGLDMHDASYVSTKRPRPLSRSAAQKRIPDKTSKYKDEESQEFKRQPLLRPERRSKYHFEEDDDEEEEALDPANEEELAKLEEATSRLQKLAAATAKEVDQQNSMLDRISAKSDTLDTGSKADNDTIAIMKENIRKVTERGDRLDALQPKTEELAQSAAIFKRHAKKRKGWWGNIAAAIARTTAETASQPVATSQPSAKAEAPGSIAMPASAYTPPPAAPSDFQIGDTGANPASGNVGSITSATSGRPDAIRVNRFSSGPSSPFDADEPTSPMLHSGEGPELPIFKPSSPSYSPATPPTMFSDHETDDPSIVHPNEPSSLIRLVSSKQPTYRSASPTTHLMPGGFSDDIELPMDQPLEDFDFDSFLEVDDDGSGHPFAGARRDDFEVEDRTEEEEDLIDYSDEEIVSTRPAPPQPPPPPLAAGSSLRSGRPPPIPLSLAPPSTRPPAQASPNIPPSFPPLQPAAGFIEGNNRKEPDPMHIPGSFDDEVKPGQGDEFELDSGDEEDYDFQYEDDDDSHGTPSMGSSFSDLDDASVTTEQLAEIARSREAPSKPTPKPKPKPVVKAMGIAPGAKLIQDILIDDDPTVHWNPLASVLLNVHIFDSASFESVTHIVPPPTPVTAAEYKKANIPFYVVDEKVNRRLKGGDFEGVLSVGQMDADKLAEIDEDEEEEDFDPMVPRMCMECVCRLCDCIVRPCNHVFCNECIMKIAKEECGIGGRYTCPQPGCGSRVLHVAGFAAPMNLPGEDAFEVDVPVTLLDVEDGRLKFKSVFTSTL